MPNLNNATGFSQPGIVSAIISPAQDFLYNLPVQYTVTNDIERMFVQAFTDSYISGAQTTNIKIKLRDWDLRDGYSSTVKKLILLLLHPEMV